MYGIDLKKQQSVMQTETDNSMQTDDKMPSIRSSVEGKL